MADADDDDGGFLSRWSRRKVQLKQGGAVPAERPETPAAPPAVAPPLPAPAEPAQPVAAAPAPAAPTLEDAARLTPESDFSRFVAPDVDPGVKNAAMKKLFADPHFNVMDGLDIYTGDYNTFEPIPKTLLRQMVQARALGLLDDELEAQDKPEPDNPAVPHEDTDLQLQPHDAPGRAGAGQGPAEPVEPRVDDGDPAHDPVPPRSA